MSRILLGMALMAVVGNAGAKGLVVVSDGQPRAAIVYPASEEKARLAGVELQACLRKMSGAELPLVAEGERVAAPVRILVGHTTAAARLGVTVPSGYDPTLRPELFEEEGYVLKTAGNDLVVGGNSDGKYKGNGYAVHALLERLGCRWYFPGEWGEIIPQLKTIEIPRLDVTSRPDFAVRGIWLSGWLPVTREERAKYRTWGERIGFNFDRQYPLVGDGFLGGLLDPNEYYDEHPEYFAMNKAGKRELHHLRNTGRYYDRHTMLCLSNPAVFAQSVENLRAAFAGERKMNIVAENGFGISPPDGAPFCYCPSCLAESENFNYPKYVHERMQSEEFFGFACKLADVFPDKIVATMAYSLRETPPQGVKLRPNMSVTVAPISCCILHTNDDPACWRRAEFMSMLKQWRRQTPHILIYDYNPGFLLGNFVPERDVANMTVNARLYRDVDIKGMNREGRKAFMQTWISYYVTAKLLWDADTNVAALKAEFYTTFFGPAAGPHVQAWFDACEAVLNAGTIHPHEDWLVNHIYTVPFTQGIHKHVEAARAAKLTEVQRSRLEVFALIADHLEGYAEMEQADRDQDYARAAAAARRMLEDQKKLHTIDPFLIDHDAKRAKPRPYFVEGRALAYDELAAKTSGQLGTKSAELPLDMRFRRDRFNEGVIAEWYAVDVDDTEWETRDTFYLWDQQEPPEDAAGHDYDGYGWYRGDIHLAESAAQKPLHFWCGGAINEAWVWVNGEYAGHKPHKIWWYWGHDFDLDVSKLVKPGPNTIAIRVWNNAELGGLYRRGFFWNPAPASPPGP